MSTELRSTVRRRVLGTNLRRLREDRGLLLEDAARELSCHPGKISRIETGRSGIRQLDLKVLLDLYGVSDPHTRESWLALARESRRERWWQALEDRLPQDFLDLIGLEEEVAACRGFQPSTVPGLLQTEAYATAIIQGGEPGPLDEDRRTRVQVRLERQKALTRTTNPLTLWIVLGETALRQQVGGAGVLRDQLRHLIEMARLPRVTLQVLPFTAGACQGGMLPFHLYSFPAPAALEVVLLEHLTSHAYLESATDTAHYTRVFDHIRATALGPMESEAYIQRLAKE
ncbi:helix-turn-helix transcriptional regulator [Streptomyces calidiresistens]|uniref:Helix-turn-helix domain-containing protein n=2 Tax=Streptomyces TaxID=1883 RepID=A0A7W3TAJ1_9ACTN|nr:MULTISPECIES: helix-turn-helix transcriptional regulator [Streptomyces]MBB0232375.1 helix-turn-helix domain-containing protein [Streptomyces calidiresistens]MBB0243095.1 helix-turn-helix domain-containing protein [Streptomyces alkaliphilus]